MNQLKMRNIRIKNDINDIKTFKEKINRKDLIYKASKYKYDFNNMKHKIF